MRVLLALAGCAPEIDHATIPAQPPVATSVRPAARPPENVLLVTVDDIGVDLVGLYGAEGAPPTPTLDALAAEGVTFDRAYAMPLCSVTRASLLTGRYPTRTGVGSVMEYEPRGAGLRDAEVTLAELLAEAPDPWDTAIVGKWHVSNLYDGTALDGPRHHGFRRAFTTTSYVGSYSLWQKQVDGVSEFVGHYATTEVTNDAVHRIEELSEPWLLSVNYHAAHAPLHDPPASLAPGAHPTDRDKLDAMIVALDAELGRLLASMGPALRRRTTVVVLGDNGSEGIGDHGKGSAFEGGVRVPFIVAGPRVAAPGSRSAGLVSVVDVFPTVADIAGIDLQDGGHRAVDGRSLLPALEDPDAPVHDSVFVESFTGEDAPMGPGRTWGLRSARYKLVGWEGWGYVPHEDGLALFDLDEDPDETDDLAGDPEHAEILSVLRDQFDALEADLLADPG
ncbi:MAG: sulfatase-like hydrolase/transferase [Myxococcota bacterium]